LILITLVEVDKYQLLLFPCGTDWYCETCAAVGDGEPESVPSEFFKRNRNRGKKEIYQKLKAFVFYNYFPLFNALGDQSKNS
jgi:hypothetical protein